MVARGGGGGGLFSGLHAVSAFPRYEEHLLTRTSSGAAVSLLGVSLMALLFVAELASFVQPVQKQRMQVDTARRETFSIFFNVSFTNVPCHFLELDTLDESGTLRGYVMENTYKMRIDAAGRALAPPQSTADTMGQMKLNLGGMELNLIVEDGTGAKREFNAKEGCTMWGDLEVLYASGTVSFGYDSNLMLQVPDVYFKGHDRVLATHRIHAFEVGQSYPGMRSPLMGVEQLDTTPKTYEYFLKLVPTQFVSRFGRVRECFQYSLGVYQALLHREEVNSQQNLILPVVQFVYDISPIMAVIEDDSKGFLHFVVRLCAVVGGAFAIAKYVDKIIANVYHY